jgi:hypothetical protein
MRGQEVSVKNIENFLKNEANAVEESYNKFRKSNFFSRNGNHSCNCQAV